MIGTVGSNEEEYRNLQRESEQYGDLLLLENHTESYSRQCTDKLLLSFQWLAKHSRAGYVMKTDDDCYVRLGLCTREQHKLSGPFFMVPLPGILSTPLKVNGRKRTGIWYTSTFLFHLDQATFYRYP